MDRYKTISRNAPHSERPHKMATCTLMMVSRTKTHRKAVLSMLEKIMVLHEMKLMGIDISASLEKMYEKYGKEEFQHSAMVSGYGFILQ